MSTSLRGISSDSCGAQVAFRLCRAKSRDRAGALMSTSLRGISPKPLRLLRKCGHSNPSQLSLTAPFRGTPARRCHRRASSLLIRFANSLTLRRAADAALWKSLSDFACVGRSLSGETPFGRTKGRRS